MSSQIAQTLSMGPSPLFSLSFCFQQSQFVWHKFCLQAELNYDPFHSEYSIFVSLSFPSCHNEVLECLLLSSPKRKNQKQGWKGEVTKHVAKAQSIFSLVILLSCHLCSYYLQEGQQLQVQLLNLQLLGWDKVSFHARVPQSWLLMILFNTKM